MTTADVVEMAVNMSITPSGYEVKQKRIVIRRAGPCIPRPFEIEGTDIMLCADAIKVIPRLKDLKVGEGLSVTLSNEYIIPPKTQPCKGCNGTGKVSCC
jgi:hypothetical protein